MQYKQFSIILILLLQDSGKNFPKVGCDFQEKLMGWLEVDRRVFVDSLPLSNIGRFRIPP
jgi:hypothetical protein